MADDPSTRPGMAGLRGPRYELGPVLGRGANGVVHLAGDQRLGRQVAMKLLGGERELRDKDLLRFTHEAQVTGQLAHPSIVPVHDLGVLPDGRLYYTMKRIEGQSLREILVGRRRKDPEFEERWTLPLFVTTVLRVAQALAFAHDRGIVHRDVKPANIMVGDYGEVLLLDWGVARALGEERTKAMTGNDEAQPVATWRSVSAHDPTIDGTVAGTPAYMAPEQARGDIEAIGPWSDVYSVGVILYEYLARTRPIRGRTVDELLRRVIHDPIMKPSKRSPEEPIPWELDELVMRCLDKNRSNRPQTGTALAAELERFLDGSRRREEAAELTSKGLSRSAAYAKAAESTVEAERFFEDLAASTPPWASSEHRRPVWDADKRWRTLRRLRDDTYDESVALLQAALERDPTARDAREGLANLYLRRMDEAEARGEVGAARFFRAQVLRYDTGALKELLDGPSQVTVTSRPQGAEVILRPLVDADAGLLPGEGLVLGFTPVEQAEVEPGRYVLEVHTRDGLVRAPLLADRPDRHLVHVSVPDGLLPGFVVIPAGGYVRGGDPEALDARPRAIAHVPAFAIGVHPVTQGEFSRFLAEDGGSWSVWTGPEGYNDQQRAALPALGVSFAGALAYAEWASRATGRRLRLPTHDEWEKAARGVDARVFPWGGPWEPSFCNGPDATPGEAQVTPVGTYARDVSVYGVADLSGGVHEWVSGAVPHREDRRWVRGGSWNGHPRAARLCSRLVMPANSRGGTIGFRLVQEI